MYRVESVTDMMTLKRLKSNRHSIQKKGVNSKCVYAAQIKKKTFSTAFRVISAINNDIERSTKKKNQIKRPYT